MHPDSVVPGRSFLTSVPSPCSAIWCYSLCWKNFFITSNSLLEQNEDFFSPVNIPDLSDHIKYHLKECILHWILKGSMPHGYYMFWLVTMGRCFLCFAFSVFGEVVGIFLKQFFFLLFAYQNGITFWWMFACHPSEKVSIINCLLFINDGTLFLALEHDT